MKFDVYGRFFIEVIRGREGWDVWRLEPGRRLPLPELVIPSDIPAGRVGRCLEDLLHENASPGRTIRRID